MSLAHRPRRRVLGASLAALVVLLGGAGLWWSLGLNSWLAAQLGARFNRTPYRANVEYAYTLAGQPLGHNGRAVILADSYGDGYDQLFVHQANGIGLLDHDGHNVRSLDQMNLPPEYSRREPFAALLAPYDIDGDGRSEVVAVAPRHDRSDWRLWVLDVDAQLIKGEAVLPVGVDRRRPDGIWDGVYVPLAALPVPGLAHPAVLLACVVGFDVDGRGVLAVDPVAGEVLWRYDMGCIPVSTEIAQWDLNRDGQSEIIFVAWGPSNLRQEWINHTSDDSSRVFVLDAGGELRWQRALSGPHAATSLAVADLDGDGTVEIVTVANNPKGEAGRLSVWSPGGELLFDDQRPQHRPNHVRIVDPGDGESPRVIVFHDDYTLAALLWTGRAMETVTSRRMPVGTHLNTVLDAWPDRPGQQIVLADVHGVTLLDAALRTLARVPTEEGRLVAPALVWRAHQDAIFLMLPGASQFWYGFTERPLIPIWFWFAALAAAVVLWAFVSQIAAMLGRRGATAGGKVEADPGILRAMRLQLLGSLEKGGHEKIGTLQSLRRLVWHLDAAVSMEAARRHEMPLSPNRTPEFELSASPLPRHLAAIATFRDESLPRLREVVSLAQRTAIAPHLAATCTDILDELENLLCAEDVARRNPADMLNVAERLNREAEVAFQRLRRAVEETFCCSLPRAVMRVLDAQAEALRAAGVMVEITGGDSADGAPWVHIDPPDLEFILDNLVGNAARAMAGALRKVLRVGWTESERQVVCTVADTGWGVAPEDWERIFEPGASDRPCGGLGLVRSRCDLRVYGGSLRVQTSQPGRGTTFALSLPRARVGAADGSGAALLRLVERKERA
ncbi:MAG: FG-GAP-like repeat-containing protein [Candidatus Krumholzibacteria bacterium]|nr:FG-GAP-like repeat-containing protein [Candidatus Krumholzibacteria bacterium]